jgi:hypothetical protein
MAMNGNALGDEIRALIDAVGDKTDRTALFRAIGNAIVTHITTNASVAVTVTSVSGVTVGVGTSGPGSGSGTVS